MENRWSETEADAFVARYGEQGVGADMALRVYTTRLLGADTRLVLHGGGNTSVKTTATDAYGDEVEVLCVKGSGWDMARIEPAGLPAVRLAPLRRLRARDSLGDEDMVGLQRANLLDSGAPNPSIETLLHAFLPHKYVDHTHASPVLAITDQPDGVERCGEAFGDSMAIVPYIMPGFELALAAAEAYERDPEVAGLILLKHGIFSFGDSARESYDRMIAKISAAEAYLERQWRATFATAELPRRVAAVAEVVPVLRGLTSIAVDPNDGVYERFILEHRGGEAVLAYVGGREVGRYARAGVVTPDHVIRTKPAPLIVPPPAADDLEAFRDEARTALEAFVSDYRAYFARNNAGQTAPKTALDPMPRVILVPGLGLVALGRTARDARIAADIAENAIGVIREAEAVGRFESISEADLFDIEHWSLEQAKLGTTRRAPLAGQIAVVTGGGSGIGAATAAAFGTEGAEVAVLDKDAENAARVAESIGGLAIACDVTDPDQVAAAFDTVAATFGGVDIVVSNAGAAWQGRIGEVADAVLRESFEVNFFAHQTVAKTAVRIMGQQGTGGVLLFNASKQAVNPGRDFGPYGLPKAATLFLARQYAVDYGAVGIRSNAVNADRVRTGMYDDDLLERRAAARGVGVSEYLASDNLLQREVKVDDVAQAFVALARASKTTAAVYTVDGGNIAAAPR